MTNGERLFLVLAEELNFGRAAKKCFISQQSLSDHIKRLEEHYGMSLFTRRPTVALTEAGRAVQRSLLAVRNLEQGLDAELSEIQCGASGTLRIGMNYTRAKILVPELFKWCRLEYPNVKIELTLEETLTMQELLRKGKLDCFLGVNAVTPPDMRVRPLANEGIYLVATPRYLSEHTNITPVCGGVSEEAVDLRKFDGLPFVMNYPKSTTYQLVAQFMASNDIVVENVLSVSDYDISEKICRAGLAALCAPQFFIPAILKGNEGRPEDERLCAMPVMGLGCALRFELIYNGMPRYPRFVLDCFDKIEEIAWACGVPDGAGA